MKVNKNLSFLKKYFPRHRLLVLEGGTRSGKTWSALQFLLWLAIRFRNAGLTISVVRRYYSDAISTCYRDFEEICRSVGLTPKPTMTIGTTTIQFLGASDTAKLHGTRHDVLYCNEVLELAKDDFDQLAIRTNYRIIADYNPSYYTHWFYDYILQSDSKVCHSTYKDNPYLTQEIIREIESYKDKDIEIYRIYAQGLRRERAGIVFRNWTVEDYNWDILDYPAIYGLDFGYVNPSALVGIKVADDTLYVKEFLYRQYLSTDELSELVKQAIGKHIVVCDSAEPRTIAELQRHNINAIAVKKIRNYMDSIRLLQAYRIVIAKPSMNLVKELENYAFTIDKNGRLSEEPLRINDHAIDAMRYAIMSYVNYDYRIY